MISERVDNNDLNRKMMEETFGKTLEEVYLEQQQELKKVCCQILADALDIESAKRGFIDFLHVANTEKNKEIIYMDAGVTAQEIHILFLGYLKAYYFTMCVNGVWDGRYYKSDSTVCECPLLEIYDEFKANTKDGKSILNQFQVYNPSNK